MHWNSLSKSYESEYIDDPEASATDVCDAMSDVARSNKTFGGFAAVLAQIIQLTRNVGADVPLMIIDIGTGSGDIPSAIVDWANRTGRICSVVAVDYLPQMLQLASGNVPESNKIALVQANASALPFQDKAFDIAVCALTFHHLSEDVCAAALKEMNRVTRMGFVVTDLRRDQISAHLVRLGLTLTRAHAMTLHDSAASVRRSFSPRELEKLISCAGTFSTRIGSHLYYRLTVTQDKTTKVHVRGDQMEIENTVYIRGPLGRIFELACAIQDWPAILPHYIDVKILESNEDGSRKLTTMAANRTDLLFPGAMFPVTWTSVQICDRIDHSIIFKHIGGIATGMWVRWILSEDSWGRGTKVTIAHSLKYGISVLNGAFAQQVVGKTFVSHIANQTLNTIKHIVEQEQLAKV